MDDTKKNNDIIKIDIKFDNLMNMINKNRHLVDIIKSKYVYLMNMLSTITYVKTSDFVKTVEKISENSIIYVAYVGNIEDFSFDIIGSGTILIEQKIIHNLQSVGHVEDIVVHDKYRGNCIATTIVNYLVEYAKGNNCYKCILNCSSEISQVYKKSYFKEKGTGMSIYF